MTRGFTIWIALLLASAGLRAGIITVPDQQPTIQAGIDAAVDGDTVLVDIGIYYEQIDFSGKAITVASNHLIDPNWHYVLNTIIDGSRAPDPLNASVVYFKSGEDSNSVLHGFTITGGRGSWVVGPTYSGICGGGVSFDRSGGRLEFNRIVDNHIVAAGNGHGGGVGIGGMPSPNMVIVENNRIENNSVDAQGFAEAGGAGFWSEVRMTDNVISHNQARSRGINASGAGCEVYADAIDRSPIPAILTGNTISENLCISDTRNCYGAGFAAMQVRVYFRNNIVRGNVSESGRATYGAGIALYKPIPWYLSDISGNTIENNRVIQGNGCGGGIYTTYASALISGNVLQANEAASGAGYFGDGLATVRMDNNVIRDGVGHYGGGVHLNRGTFVLVNNSIVENHAATLGGGIEMMNNAEMVLFNGILWGNTATAGPQIHKLSGTANVQYCTVEGGWAEGTDIFTDPPCFKDCGCHLSDSSGCIDRGVLELTIGDNTYYVPRKDIDGDRRPYGTTLADLGADESPFVVAGIAPEAVAVANQPVLHPAFPNPFNPSTTIAFEIPAAEQVRVVVYDLLGREVAVLVDDALTAGRYAVTWNAGERASGLYFCRMEAGKTVQTRRLLLVR